MSTLRKPRSDSKLDALDPDQQRQLCEWLLTPAIGLAGVKQLVEAEFGVSTNLSSLSGYYQRHCAAYLVQRRREAIGLASEVTAEMQVAPMDFSAATIDALSRKAFELAATPNVKPSDVKAIFQLVLKARDQDLARDKFEDQRKRAAAELEKLRKPEAQSDDAQRTAILDKVDEILGIRR